MTTSHAAAEAEVRTLQAEIEQLSETHTTAKAAALELRSTLAADEAEPGSKEFAELESAWLEADTINEQLAQKRDELVGAMFEQIIQMRTQMATRQRATRTWGRRYIESDRYQGVLAQLGGRQFTKEQTLPRVEVADAEETRLFLASTDGSAMIPTDERLTPIELPTRVVRLLDLISVDNTNESAVEIVKETLVDDNAAPTAHGSPGAQGAPATGVASPLSEYRYDRSTVNVRRIPHHTIQPRSMLSDAPRLAGLIDRRLRRGIRLATEAQVLAGDGTGENFSGILTEAASDQTHSNASDVLVDSVHKAMTLVRIAYEDDITGLVMHPTDYEDLVLQRSATDGHLANGVNPFTSTPSTVWGYPVVTTTVIAPGTILAGAFVEAVLYVREGIEVMSGFINQQMIEDLVTVNAEYRAAFGVERPQAFATVTRGA